MTCATIGRKRILMIFRINLCRKEDWNTLVRKNTIARDPIGSTRNSISRRDRRSLRRRILEEADRGLTMDTDKIVGMHIMIGNTMSPMIMNSLPSFSFYSTLFSTEYNPKLSDATSATRVAYVKFMAHTLRKEQNEDDQADVKIVHEKKSILRTTSKASVVCGHAHELSQNSLNGTCSILFVFKIYRRVWLK